MPSALQALSNASSTAGTLAHSGHLCTAAAGTWSKDRTPARAPASEATTVRAAWQQVTNPTLYTYHWERHSAGSLAAISACSSERCAAVIAPRFSAAASTSYTQRATAAPGPLRTRRSIIACNPGQTFAHLEALVLCAS